MPGRRSALQKARAMPSPCGAKITQKLTERLTKAVGRRRLTLFAASTRSSEERGKHAWIVANEIGVHPRRAHLCTRCFQCRDGVVAVSQGRVGLPLGDRHASIAGRRALAAGIQPPRDARTRTPS